MMKSVEYRYMSEDDIVAIVNGIVHTHYLVTRMVDDEDGNPVQELQSVETDYRKAYEILEPCGILFKRIEYIDGRIVVEHEETGR